MLVLNVIEIQGICCLFGIRDMKINENTSVSMPMKNLISIVIAVAVGVWAYFGVVETLNKY